jgi:large subunit ribosomal protein L10
MTKRRLMKIAIESVKDSKPGIEKLIPYLKGMPALIFTKDNPFTLYKKLDKSKSTAPAKAGQQAPNDIVVRAGPTPFAPGPIIGELGAFKIKSGIEDGKVVIKADSIVAKEGDVINAALAGILSRLGIEPMEIGLNITATYEDGMIFTKDVLAIDEKEYTDNMTRCATWAFNLAMEAGYLTEETTKALIVKAYNDSKALAISQSILADGVVDHILAKAHGEMMSLKTTANIQD